MEGGITVSKVTTGTYLIRDIQVQVAHKEMTFIPMHQVNLSSDLHKALGSRELFQLSSVVPHKPEEVPPPKAVVEKTAPISPLEVENRQLKELIANLQKDFKSMEAKIDQILGFMKNSPPAVAVSGLGGKPPVEDDVVQIAVPMFIPDIEAKEVVGSITTTSEESDGSSISGATSKLREMRSRNR